MPITDLEERKDYAQIYREKNHERIKEQKRLYREINREKLLLSDAQYRASHKTSFTCTACQNECIILTSTYKRKKNKNICKNCNATIPHGLSKQLFHDCR